MTPEELKAAIFAFNLSGKDNVIFFDRNAIDIRVIEQMCLELQEKGELAEFEGYFVPVNVPSYRTLRGCVMLRNPFTGWLVSRWFRFTYWLMEKRNKEIVR